MKKLLFLATLAFGTLTLGAITHADDWYTPIKNSSEIMKEFNADSERMPQTFLAIKINFGITEDDYDARYSYFGEDPQCYEYKRLSSGRIYFSYRDVNLKLESGAKYDLVSQKIEGTHTPNASCLGDFDSVTSFAGPDLDDTKVHHTVFNTYPSYKSNQLFFKGNFGYHVSGSETIAMYLRKLS